MKKFEFTGEVKTLENGTEVKRIRALKEFTLYFGITVKEGELGGWLEKEENLSQEGCSWVYGNANVSGNAHVYGNANVSGDAWVYGNARVAGNAHVSGNAHVYGNANVSGDAWVYADARVAGNAHVSGNAHVYGNANVSGDAHVYGDAGVSGNARVGDNAFVSGDAHVSGGAFVEKSSHVLQVGPVGSRDDTTTFYRDTDGGIRVCCGCFSGTLDEFEDKVRETHGDNKHSQVYRAAAALARLQIDDVTKSTRVEKKKFRLFGRRNAR